MFAVYKNGKRICTYSEKDILELKPNEVISKKQLTPEEELRKNDNKYVTRTELKVYDKQAHCFRTFTRASDFAERVGMSSKIGYNTLFQRPEIYSKYKLIEANRIRSTIGEIKQIYLNEPIRLECN